MAPTGETLASGRLALAFGCMLLVPGLANIFPVFFPALLAEFGASRAATASPLALFWTGGALLGPVAGWLVARRDPRLVVAGGLAIAALGFAAGSRASSLAGFALAVGVGAGIGAGLVGMAAQATLLADAFVRRRGVAMGIAFSGSMAAWGLAPPVQWAISRAGWRGALAGYAALVLALVPLAWRALPRRLRAAPAAATPAGGPPEAPVRAILARPAFWALAVLFGTTPLGGALATTQHVVYLVDRGFSAWEASAYLAAGGVLAGMGRVLFGAMADRIGAPLAGFVSFASSLVGLLCLLLLEAWPARVLAFGYVLFLFLPMGSRSTIVSVLVGRIAPPARYGVVFGLVGIGNSLGAGLGPLLSGALYDWTGSYRFVYGAAVAVLLVGVAALAAYGLLTGAPTDAGGERRGRA